MVSRADDTPFSTGPHVAPAGFLADDTSPDSVDEGDVGAGAMTLAREVYVTPKKRGASEVIMARLSIAGGDGTTVQTMVTPTSGKRIRIISISIGINATAESDLEVYFGAGANITTTVAKAIIDMKIAASTIPSNMPFIPWPDGAGPLGAVNDVLSVRHSVAINGKYYALYREE